MWLLASFCSRGQFPRQRAATRSQREIDADSLQREQHAQRQQQRADELAETGPDVAVEMRRPRQALLEEARHPKRAGDDQDDDDRALQNLENGNVLAADGDCDRVELVARSGSTPLKWSSTRPHIVNEITRSEAGIHAGAPNSSRSA